MLHWEPAGRTVDQFTIEIEIQRSQCLSFVILLTASLSPATSVTCLRMESRVVQFYDEHSDRSISTESKIKCMILFGKFAFQSLE